MPPFTIGLTVFPLLIGCGGPLGPGTMGPPIIGGPRPTPGADGPGGPLLLITGGPVTLGSTTGPAKLGGPTGLGVGGPVGGLIPAGVGGPKLPFTGGLWGSPPGGPGAKLGGLIGPPGVY